MNRLDVPAAVRAQESAFTADAAALSWLDAARHNLVAAVVQASDGDWQRSRWLLADAVRGYFWFQGSPRESVAVAEAAMKPADDEGDVGSRAATRMAAAMAQFRIRDIPRAADRLTSRSN